jgi:hypothetical protein
MRVGVAQRALTGIHARAWLQGEDQKKLDVVSNEVFCNALRASGRTGVIASEEEDLPVAVEETYSGARPDQAPLWLCLVLSMSCWALGTESFGGPLTGRTYLPATSFCICLADSYSLLTMKMQQGACRPSAVYHAGCSSRLPGC